MTPKQLEKKVLSVVEHLGFSVKTTNIEDECDTYNIANVVLSGCQQVFISHLNTLHVQSIRRAGKSFVLTLVVDNETWAEWEKEV